MKTFVRWSPTNYPIPAVRKLQDKLETAIAPWVSEQKGPIDILFRSKRVYLKPPQHEKRNLAHTPETIMQMALGLQCLYKFESAIQRGQHNLAFKMAVGIGMHLQELGVLSTGGMYTVELVSRVNRRREASAKGGQASAKWNFEFDTWARAIFAQEKRAKVSDDAAYRRTVARLKSEHGITLSKDTVKRRLTKPPTQ